MKTKKKTIKKAAKLTKIEEKRVAILKDAIAQIKRQAYIAQRCNGYVVNYDMDEEINEFCTIKNAQKEFKTVINRFINPEKPCEVCAKGAILLSAIRKFNNFTIEQATYEGLDNKASTKARQLFGRKNADEMERFFENYSLFATFEQNDKWNLKSDNEKLIIIFQNAIKNKGIFKPDQIKL